MNFMTLVGSMAQDGSVSGTAFSNSCALILLLAGGISLAVAGVLIARTPKLQSAKYIRRR